MTMSPPRSPSLLPRPLQTIGSASPDFQSFLPKPEPVMPAEPTMAMLRDQLHKMLLQRKLMDQAQAIREHPVFRPSRY